MAGTGGPGGDERALAADLLRGGSSVRLTLTGHSMSPSIRSGDVVTIEPLSGRRPAVGEVVAAAPEGRLLVHRLVAWDGAAALCRGDVAASADPPTAPGDLLGRVTRVERGGRRVLFGLGVERRPIAWLSRVGVLRLLARLRERLRS